MTLLVKMSANVVSSPSSPPLSASLFFDNPYFSAGAGLIGIGTGLAILRRVSLRYALYLQRQLFTSVEISNKDKSYYWVLHWLSEVQSSTVSSLTKATSDQHTGRLNVDARRILPFSFSFFRYSSNHLSVQTTFQQHENGSTNTQFSLIPSPGTHYMQWSGRWIKVTTQTTMYVRHIMRPCARAIQMTVRAYSCA